jgi:xanthine/uracil/vitamin C permease (AzgA family)
MNAVGRFFKFDQRGTTFSREVIAGLTTFTTMSYIVVVNPAILSNAGIPAGPSFVATVVAAMFGCTLMGLYANRPFAIAPYMGENAFTHSLYAGNWAINGKPRWRQSLLPACSLCCLPYSGCGNGWWKLCRCRCDTASRWELASF